MRVSLLKCDAASNRGTEYNKAPEMLRIAEAHKNERAEFDRRKARGAGAATDVWSIGCMLYELITSVNLYYDASWIRFYTRVTNSRLPVVEAKKAR